MPAAMDPQQTNEDSYKETTCPPTISLGSRKQRTITVFLSLSHLETMFTQRQKNQESMTTRDNDEEYLDGISITNFVKHLGMDINLMDINI